MNFLSFSTNGLFTTKYIIGQVFVVLGYLFHFACYCLPKKTQIVICDCIAKAMTIVSFVFLDSLAGILSNAIIIVRCIVVFLREKYNKKLLWCYIVIMLMLVGSGVWSLIREWDEHSFWGLFAYIPMLVSTTTTWFFGPQAIRLGQMGASVIYLVFQISIPNIAGIALECVVIVICVVTYFIYFARLRKQSSTQIATTEETLTAPTASALTADAQYDGENSLPTFNRSEPPANSNTSDTLQNKD